MRPAHIAVPNGNRYGVTGLQCAHESQNSLQDRQQSPQRWPTNDNTFIIYLSFCIPEVFAFFYMCILYVKDIRINVIPIQLN